MSREEEDLQISVHLDVSKHIKPACVKPDGDLGEMADNTAAELFPLVL